MQPKILVGIPYHPAKNYCIKKCLDRANELTYPNKEIVMRFDPNEYGSQDSVKKQREFFRKLMIEGGFDYLYFFGVDTIPPEDVLERLLAHKVDIAGGVYWGRHDAHNGRPEGAVAWLHDYSQEQQTDLFKTRNQFIPIDGMGMDCVLLSFNVVVKISWLDWEQNDDDYPFYDAAARLGIKTHIDTNVQCKHYFTSDSYTYLGEVWPKKAVLS